jgi:hypothetical protein
MRKSRNSLNGDHALLSPGVFLTMDFFIAVLLLFAAIMFGIFYKEIIHWLFHNKNVKKK